MKTIFAVASFVLLGASSSLAEIVSVSVAQAVEIESPAGSKRVLLSVPVETERGHEIAVARAVLRVPASASETRGEHKVCAFPITASWSAGAVGWSTWEVDGGDIDRSRGSWATADLNRSELILDVTPAVQSAMRFGEPFEGLLICPLEGQRDGFETTDLAGIDFESATVEITMREIGKRPARGLGGVRPQ
jgi:hypothetical protein